MGSKCVMVIVTTVSMEFCLVIFVYFLTIASGLFTMIGYNFDCMDIESSVL